MKKFILLSLVIFLCSNVNAQNLSLLWAGQFFGPDDELGRTIAVDAAGNVYSAGQFQGLVDFDPSGGTTNLSANGSDDIYISKLNAAGMLQWVKQVGGFSSDAAYALTLDAGGNILVTGFFAGTVDFNPGPGVMNLTSSVGSNDVFILKLDGLGNFIWAKSIGSGMVDFASSIDTDAAGGVYISGFFNGSVDFDPGPGTFSIFSNGFSDMYILKLDATGAFVAAIRIGGTLTETSRAIKVNAMGQIFIAGYFSGTVDFDPGAGTTNLTANGNRDAFVCKLNAAGNLVWAKQFGGPDDDEIYGMDLDGNGNVIVTGDFRGTVDFDPGAGTSSMTAAGGTDVFVSKLDPNGNYLWAKIFGGSSFDRGLSVAVDPLGDIYSTGYFADTADFDPGAGVQNLTAAAFNDGFVSKLDNAGNFDWAFQLNSSSGGAGNAIVADEGGGGNVHVTGEFEGSMDADPGTGSQNLFSIGGKDIFVQKFNQVGVGIFDGYARQDFEIYPNPSNGSFTIKLPAQSEEMTLRVYDALGKTYFSAIYGGISLIDLDLDAPSGLYFVELLSEVNVRSTQKFILY